MRFWRGHVPICAGGHGRTSEEEEEKEGSREHLSSYRRKWYGGMLLAGWRNVQRLRGQHTRLGEGKR